ncbi:hypothetical protein IWQ60_001138 [Tieghemiomyces parasiticus]|uniref:Uncharacterized protein n=1 Tax=Tieghemiomyces parasiticus TaxID=78921 RepID=A0A9W8AEI5_9FUNG|nr:hypothetical protein IWQ60_001138 [Tieghemiomyces parasiticus]
MRLLTPAQGLTLVLLYTSILARPTPGPLNPPLTNAKPSRPNVEAIEVFHRTMRFVDIGLYREEIVAAFDEIVEPFTLATLHEPDGPQRITQSLHNFATLLRNGLAHYEGLFNGALTQYKQALSMTDPELRDQVGTLLRGKLHDHESTIWHGLHPRAGTEDQTPSKGPVNREHLYALTAAILNLIETRRIQSLNLTDGLLEVLPTLIGSTLTYTALVTLVHRWLDNWMIYSLGQRLHTTADLAPIHAPYINGCLTDAVVKVYRTETTKAFMTEVQAGRAPEHGSNSGSRGVAEIVNSVVADSLVFSRMANEIWYDYQRMKFPTLANPLLVEL